MYTALMLSSDEDQKDHEAEVDAQLRALEEN
jgi:hypothetical protein